MTLRMAAKRLLLPRGPHPRLLRGLGHGIVIDVDFKSQTRIFLGLYERELRRDVVAFCRPGFKCADVGAGIGYHSLVFARLTSSRVLAFECDEHAHGQLTRNLGLNPDLAQRIEVLRLRIGRRSDPREGVVSLDDAVRRHFDPDFVKIDTDGTEVDVIQGAVELLKRRRPHLIVETHSSDLERQCDGLLRRLGYRPRIVDQAKLLPDYRPLDHNRWLVAEGMPGGRVPGSTERRV